MKNKITWAISIVLIIILLFLVVAKSVDEDSWVCTEKGWMEHGKPSAPKPTVICSTYDKEKLVENYLRENISAISPRKEVLGGKFYITKIIWMGNDSAAIEYEDGHIVVAATLDYEIKTDKNSSSLVIINNFKIAE